MRKRLSISVLSMPKYIHTDAERQDIFNSCFCGAAIVRVGLVGAIQPPITSGRPVGAPVRRVMNNVYAPRYPRLTLSPLHYLDH